MNTSTALCIENGGNRVPVSPTSVLISPSDLLLEEQAKSGHVELWHGLGFEHNPDGSSIPAGMIVLVAETPLDRETLGQLAQRLPGPPLTFTSAGCTRYVYRLDDGCVPQEGLKLPVGVRLLGTGEIITLPAAGEFDPAKAPSQPPIMTAADLSELARVPLDPEVKNTPLRVYSLRGKADHYEQLAVDCRPLLGPIGLTGEATVIYAPPNLGKTLVVLKLLHDAVAEGRINPANVYYVNADDSGAGLAQKLRLLDDIGVHTLCPGEAGFEASDLSEILHRSVDGKSARGVVVVLDTLKKFTDLMAKKETAEFAEGCRQFVRHGGTVIALAHTNKNRDAKGKLVPTGTGDLIQDFDAAFVGDVLEGVSSGSEKVVQFEAVKRRSGGASCVAFAYTNEADVSYSERLASVRMVDPDELSGFQRVEEEQADSVIIDAICTCITNGIVKKMDLAAAAAKASKVTGRAAMRVLERYTGSDPATAHWDYVVGERGAKLFALLDKPDPETQSPDT